LSDGVEYDADGDGSVTVEEKQPVGQWLDR
jgi:hypothetical protein